MKILNYLFILISLSSCFEDKSRMMVDGKMEPPVPDESENNETIGGIDSNNDGVRDDIERWINRRFPGEENYNKRLAWKQKAKRIRDVLINSNSKEQAIELVNKENEAFECISFIYADSNEDVGKEKRETSKELEELHLDTKERLDKYLYADRSYAGQVWVLAPYDQKLKMCDFSLKQ